MPRPGIKLIVGTTAIALALGYLGLTGVRAGWVYYVSVDAYAQRPETHEARARVHGVVGQDPALRPTAFLAEFDLRGQSHSIRVEYHGPIPDMFAPGREVVVEGTTDDRGIFVADVLLTKCGSKYEPASPDP